jgi:hypothetical protein
VRVTDDTDGAGTTVAVRQPLGDLLSVDATTRAELVVGLCGVSIGSVTVCGDEPAIDDVVEVTQVVDYQHHSKAVRLLNTAYGRAYKRRPGLTRIAADGDRLVATRRERTPDRQPRRHGDCFVG